METAAAAARESRPRSRQELLTSSFPGCTSAVFQPRLSSLILLTSAETRAQFSN